MPEAGFLLKRGMVVARGWVAFKGTWWDALFREARQASCYFCQLAKTCFLREVSGRGGWEMMFACHLPWVEWSRFPFYKAELLLNVLLAYPVYYCMYFIVSNPESLERKIGGC